MRCSTTPTESSTLPGVGRGAVVGVHRYPVKSLGGESLGEVGVTSLGPVGDRNWAIIDERQSVIRSAKQWPELLTLQATYLVDPPPDAYDEQVASIVIRSVDGSSCSSDAAEVDEWLSDRLGRPARLSRRRPAHDRDHYRLPWARTPEEIASDMGLFDDEVFPDFGGSDDELVASLQTLATPPGSYVDGYPVHLVTSNSLSTFARRSGRDAAVARFRPNVLIDAESDDEEPELGWVGRVLRVGEVLLAVRGPTMRCSMPARPQPLAGIDDDRDLTRALVRHMRRLLGVNAIVLEPGTVRVGDTVEVLGPSDDWSNE